MTIKAFIIAAIFFHVLNVCLDECDVCITHTGAEHSFCSTDECADKCNVKEETSQPGQSRVAFILPFNGLMNNKEILNPPAAENRVLLNSYPPPNLYILHTSLLI